MAVGYLVTLGKLLWNKMPLQWSISKFGKRLPKNCKNLAVNAKLHLSYLRIVEIWL